VGALEGEEASAETQGQAELVAELVWAAEVVEVEEVAEVVEEVEGVAAPAFRR
jgi:hypothetical protein